MTFLTSLILSGFLWATPSKDFHSVDALLGKVAQEPILRSDLRRYRDVVGIMECAGLRTKSEIAKISERKLVDVFVDEEVMYLEAKNKKINSAGMISEAVSKIHKNSDCKQKWLTLGENYNFRWRSSAHQLEGQGLLVRELEKRLLVDRFKATELVSDSELWKKEARARFPIKIYLE